MKLRKIMGVVTGVSILLTAMIALKGTAQSALGVEHTHTIIQRPDGQFDVTCLDGVSEVKSRADVLGNRLCTHLKTYAGRWVLIEGGIDNGSRFCDLNLDMIRSDHNIIKLQAGFAPPCAAAPVTTQQCAGLSCSLRLGSQFFSFDFSVAGRMTLTRLEDGFTAVYRGNGGAGTGSPGTARLIELEGVPNILQTTIDGGNEWLSVCDDSFNQAAAAVACRELGFRGVDRLITGVTVRNDSRFGWDDLVCQGTESSLSECQHNAWGDENCGESEHVQLYCTP